ncbi:MAG: alpha/beta fold hydrolase [Bacteroidota bacterium]
MKLHFKSFGQGPAVIILHGLFGSLDNWVSLGRQLAEDFSVYLVDQRNHGRSPHDDEWNYELMAEDLAEFMEDQGVLQAHLIGHSMGGKTVMQFAGMNPYQIDKLIVADMAPVVYSPHHTSIIEALNSVPVGDIKNREEADEWLQKGIEEWGVRQFLLKGLGRNKAGGFRWKFNLRVLSDLYPNVLETVSMDHPFDGPTLFLYGGTSTYVLPDYHPTVRELFPAVEFVEMPEAGHWLHADDPQGFLQEVRRFLL